jgi:hypothetical protein
MFPLLERPGQLKDIPGVVLFLARSDDGGVAAQDLPARLRRCGNVKPESFPK